MTEVADSARQGRTEPAGPGFFLIYCLLSLVAVQILLDVVVAASGNSYAMGFLYLVAILTLLFLPGYALSLSCQRSKVGTDWDVLAVLPVPGLIILSAFGLFIWLVHPGHALLIGQLLRYAILITSIVVVWLRRSRLYLPASWRLPAGLYVLLVLVAFIYSFPIFNVTQEWYAHTHWESRMAASPPDSAIPFQTGVYFLHGHNGKELARDYFGDWSVASRGPLVPLVNTSTLDMMKFKPHDPPQSTPNSQFDVEGYFIGRLNGIVTNALIILAAGALLSRLESSPSAIRFGLLWLACTPFVFINVGFTWPKLAAAYFLILAFTDVLADRSRQRIGVWSALAYFSHPVGGLFFLPIVLLEALRSRASPLKHPRIEFLESIIGQSFWIVLFIAPWLMYKLYLNQSDPLLRYVLGDGRGTLTAMSPRSWLTARYRNITLTLIPFNFWFEPYMRSWVGGPLSDWVRWAIQNAKTLPAGLGFGLMWFYYNPFSIRPRDLMSRQFLQVAVFVTFVLMLIYWGYSSDGLGRDCLEPLAVLVLLYAASQVTTMNWPLKLGLVAVTLETVYVAVVPVVM